MSSERIEKVRALETLRVFLEKFDVLKIHLGCGSVILQDWLNLDLSEHADLRVDLTKKLFLYDNSVDYIYSQHFLEHLELHEAKGLLAECYRVLKPSATMRICIPDVSALLSIVTDKNWKERRSEWTGKSDFASHIELLNYGMYYMCNHKYMYDFDELQRVALEVAPWSKVIKCIHGESEHSHLRTLETRCKKGDLIMEFTK